MISKISKYTLWLGIAVSLIIIGAQLPAIYKSGRLSNELLPIAISMVIICSPYIFMLFRLVRITKKGGSLLKHLIFSILITVSGVSIIFALFYIMTPDAQNGIVIFFIVFLQWVVCVVGYIME